jgi:hypothetical protein
MGGSMAEKITVSGLMKRIEKTITEKVYGNYPYNWDEDFITEEIIRDFRNNYKRIELVDKNYTRTIIEWSGYKLRGNPENFFGDIGILVRLHSKDGMVIEGIAFLEAKKRYENSACFDAIKMDQIERILNNTPRSMVLLYAYRPIVCNNIILPGEFFPNTYAVALPSYIIMQTNNNTEKLYDFSIPFSYQLCTRYFNGFDLDFSKENIAIVKGFANKKPKFVLTINIAQGYEQNSGEELVVNNDYYTDEF